MNFRRIEWIFFIAFIMLDIFLFLSILKQGPLSDSVTNNHTENTTISALKNIKDNQINVGKTSTRTEVGYYASSLKNNYLKNKCNQLRSQNLSYNNGMINSTFNNPIKLNVKDPQITLDSIIRNASQIIQGRHYHYCKQLSTKNDIIYAQYIDDKPIYDNSGEIRFYIKNGYINGYTQGYMDNLHILRGSRKILSQKQALIWLYQYNKIPTNSTIEWSYLVYSNLLSINGNTIYVPSWIFCIKNNSSGNIVYKRVNAFTGTVM